MGTLGSTQSQETTADVSNQASCVAFDNAGAVKLCRDSGDGNQNRLREIQSAARNLAAARTRVWVAQKGICEASGDSRATATSPVGNGLMIRCQTTKTTEEYVDCQPDPQMRVNQIYDYDKTVEFDITWLCRVHRR